MANVTPPIQLAIGLELDRWAKANGIRERGYVESDVGYRNFILSQNPQWVLIHPDFGQSMDMERIAILQNEIALKERKHKFNFIARMGGEKEI